MKWLLWLEIKLKMMQLRKMYKMSEDHRWSGWPGAWCLDCWIEDPREVCLADGHDVDCSLPDCQVKPCMELGSCRCDPYKPKTRILNNYENPI